MTVQFIHLKTVTIGRDVLVKVDTLLREASDVGFAYRNVMAVIIPGICSRTYNDILSRS